MHIDVSPALVLIALVAAIVNGALGYGFSSITVPLALLFLTNRLLNPALVLIEVVLNAYVLWVNRAALPRVWRRTRPIVIGLAPGIVLGTLVVAQVNASWLRFGTFVVLLPLVLLQAAGYRRPIESEGPAALGFGVGLGALYSITTISGPPLAAALTNQGLSKHDFRAALGVVRLAESTMTAAAYLAGGLVTAGSLALIPQLIPGVIVGVPVGAFVIRHVKPETFRRVCMSFDAWIVSFGISTLLRTLGVVPGLGAFAVTAVVVVLDSWLLFRFFTGKTRAVDAPVDHPPLPIH
jgi:uncharacterized membrane protein YfcA